MRTVVFFVALYLGERIPATSKFLEELGNGEFILIGIFFMIAIVLDIHDSVLGYGR